MNTESVVEFLGNVPLLQRLPSSSLKRISEVVVFKRYERGDYVVRKNQDVDGVYFLLEGQAQVLRSSGEENSQQFLLKRFDFFGPGIFGDVYSADVVAVSELTCLLLMSDHRALLETKSVSDSDNEPCLVEHILYLEPLDLNVFRGFTPPNAPTYGKVYGGQLVGQALAAASKTVENMKIVHNLHSYFLLVGEINSKGIVSMRFLQASNCFSSYLKTMPAVCSGPHAYVTLCKFSYFATLAVPIIFEVIRLRDGNNFATRRVDARQKGKTIFILFASFQRKQQGFIHQESIMPHTPAPEMLLPREEMLERRITDPLLPRDYRNKVAIEINASFPIDIRFCEPNYSTEQTKSPPRLKYWFRAKGRLSDADQALHRCVVAYASDLIFASISLNPHRREGMSVAALSLDHSMWFHRPLRADDWLLFVIVSLIASESRGFATGKMFNRKGELVVSLTQEAVLREAVTIKPSFGAKL